MLKQLEKKQALNEYTQLHPSTHKPKCLSFIKYI